jgi:hypothetical protein
MTGELMIFSPKLSTFDQKFRQIFRSELFADSKQATGKLFEFSLSKK